jgi:hypothetical protein
MSILWRIVILLIIMVVVTSAGEYLHGAWYPLHAQNDAALAQVNGSNEAVVAIESVRHLLTYVEALIVFVAGVLLMATPIAKAWAMYKPKEQLLKEQS